MNDQFNLANIYFNNNDTFFLKNINFSFKTGEIICILGNNGSGKSTFLKVCAGILKPSCGTVTLDRKNIHTLADEERAKLVAWQPQSLSTPYNMTLAEFMKLTPGYNCEELLKLFEIEKLKDKNISAFSGGEWKRSQLARLWQSNAKLVLLDEPDSDLDLRHKKKLVHFCKNYVQQNKAIMAIVTHDIVFAKEVADRVCALSEGYLVWNSRSDEFWNTKVINKIFSTKVF